MDDDVMRPVYIKWLDSGLFIADGWEPVAQVLPKARLTGMTCTTIGHLVHEDDEVVVVGLSHDESNEAIYGAQVIARRNVLEFKYLDND
jgi:hypothetical protein